MWKGQGPSTEYVVIFNNVILDLFLPELYAKMEAEGARQRRSKLAQPNPIIKVAIATVANKYQLDEDDYSNENFRKNQTELYLVW